LGVSHFRWRRLVTIQNLGQEVHYVGQIGFSSVLGDVD
jgi:hypothetical protein